MTITRINSKTRMSRQLSRTNSKENIHDEKTQEREDNTLSKKHEDMILDHYIKEEKANEKTSNTKKVSK